MVSLPTVTFKAGDTVLAAGSKTGLLLILKRGSVVIIKNGTEIAHVTEPGAVVGELSALLDKPHTADVRALEESQFYVANAEVLLKQNPVGVLYVASVLASRLDKGNETVIELKTQIQTRDPDGVLGKTVEKLERQLHY
jgi:CRP-like cAMP-binding protein